MRRFAALALPLLLLASGPAPAAQPLPDGFHGLKWRSGVAPGMKLKKDVSVGDNAAYTRPNDSKKLHGAVLESVIYSYYKGQLCSATVETDPGQGAKLLKALTTEWGEPEKAAANVFVWKDTSETMVIFRGTDLEGSGSRAEVFVVCKPLVEEANKAERERREKLLGLK
ncbi:MAG: hypothetical protein ABI768_01945 [Acidobacteriota bacterium]